MRYAAPGRTPPVPDASCGRICLRVQAVNATLLRTAALSASSGAEPIGALVRGHRPVDAGRPADRDMPLESLLTGPTGPTARAGPNDAVPVGRSRVILNDMEDQPLQIVQRWERAGGHWQLLSRGPPGLVVSLLRCDSGEEAHRLTTDDPLLTDYIGDRHSDSD